MTTMNGGEAVVQALKEEGVGVVFGLAGVQILSIYDALYQNPEIRHITVRHEQATVYMADAYARVAGKVGVALAISGPGAANTLAAMGTAHAASSPVVLITGQVERENIGRGRGIIHEMSDQLEVFRPFTKWRRRVEAVEEIPNAIHEAFAQAKSGRPRPIHLEIPTDVLQASSNVSPGKRRSQRRAKVDRLQVARLGEALLSARQPAIWAGGGVISAEATNELREVAEFLQAPVLTTVMGKGAIRDNHYLSLGPSADLYGAEVEFGEESDVVLAVGTRLLAAVRGCWGLKPSQAVYQIDADKNQIGKNCAVRLGIVGDAKEILKELMNCLRTNGQPRPSRKQEMEAIRAERRRTLRQREPQLVPALEDLRSMLKRDAIVVSDITVMGSWANLAFDVYEPRTYLSYTYFGTMGFGVAAAVGAKIAHPERQVVAICGDGGFLVTCQELATATRYGANITVILANNDCYGDVKAYQKRKYDARYIGVDLTNPDFVKLAEAFGAEGRRVNSLSDLRPALQEVLAADRTKIIEVPVCGILPPAPH